MPATSRKRKSKRTTTQRGDNGAVKLDLARIGMTAAPGSADYTQLLRPCEEWLNVFTDDLLKFWRSHWHARGLCYFGNKLQLREGEQRVRLYHNPHLAYPSRGQPSHGYSWTSWTFAARSAGVKAPMATLSDISAIAQAGLEYATSTLDDWYRNSATFTDHVGQMLEGRRKSTISSPTPAETVQADMITARVWDLFQQAMFWCYVKRMISVLRNMGMSDRGWTISAEIRASGLPIDSPFFRIADAIRYQKHRQNVIMQEAFATFINPNAVNTVVITSPQLPVFDEAQPSIALRETRKQLHERSFFEYTLAGLSGLLEDVSDVQETCLNCKRVARFPFGFYSLAYEQSLKKDPELTSQVHPHFQKLIGEAAMLEEVRNAVMSVVTTSLDSDCGHYLTADDLVSEEATEDEAHIPNDYQHIKLEHLKSKGLCTPFDIPEGGRFDEDTAKRFWEYWDSNIRQQTGGASSMSTLHVGPARWSPTETEDAEQAEAVERTCHDLSTLSLAQSGHKYLRDELGPQFTDKVKTRGNPSPPEEAARCDDVKVNALSTSDDTKSEDVTDNISVFYVNNKQMKLVRKLFSESGEEDGQGQIRWDDFYKLMKRVGFLVEEIGGSVVRFVPPNNAGTPFNEHRPHPEVAISSVRYRALDQKLKDRYGWTAEWFARAPETDRNNVE
ncbi:hypothetical protein IAU59_002357 [Kwoniella sp. CBS 9459]